MKLLGPVFVDDVLDDAERLMLFDQFPRLLPGMRQFRPSIMVPDALVLRITSIVQSCALGQDPSKSNFKQLVSGNSETHLPVPGKVSVGSSRAMHQDTQLGEHGDFDQNIVQGYVAVLYLDGCGELIFDSGFGEVAIELKPGRLIVWWNESCMHRVEASPDGRARSMLGPMYVSEDGHVEAVGHRYSLMSGYSGKTLPGFGLEQQAAETPKSAVCITLTKEPGEGNSVVLVGTGLSGERLFGFEIPTPDDMTFRMARERLIKDLPMAKSKDMCFKFLLTDGTLIGDDYENFTISELFEDGLASKSSGAPYVPIHSEYKCESCGCDMYGIPGICFSCKNG